VEHDPAGYAICVHPSAPGLQRKGTLAIITEAAGSHQSLAEEARRLAQQAIVESYFADSSLSLTSSLLNALDHANTALLRYNYASHEPPHRAPGEVTVQNGAKLGRARVGATAVLLRPDGEGVYLSQMAPTQAYVWHNGLLSAIPEPAAWRQAPEYSMAVLSSAQGAGIEELEGEDAVDTVPDTSLPSPSLGSGPGVEADLVYRRIAAGDMVVLLSTSLARYLDRERAEHIMSRCDADGVVNALRAIATDNGLAEAHACVLELGVLDSSGVEDDYRAPARAQQGNQVAGNGGITAAPHSPQRPAMPNFREVLRGPREWLQRHKLEPEQINETPPLAQSASPAVLSIPVPVPLDLQLDSDTGAHDEAEQSIDGTALDEEQEYFWTKQPTLLFTHNPVEVPPYKAAHEPAGDRSAAGSWEDESGEELQFDGWEDAPPALDDPQYDGSHKILFKPATYYTQDEREDGTPAAPSSGPALWAVPAYQQPGLFDSNDFRVNFDEVQANQVSGRSSAAGAPRVAVPKVDVRGIANRAGNAGSWLLTTTRSLVPDRLGRDILSGKALKIGKTIPLRLVIVAALVVAGILFFLSIRAMAGNGQKNAATHNTLQEAQQMETLANQPGLLAADRLQKLQLALGKANEAVAANPQSPDARLLAGKIQNEIDLAQGITRFGSVKLLFDLSATDTASTTTGTGAMTTGTTTSAAQNPVSNTLSLPINDIVVQSNDAYILDRAASKLYRCQIVAATCAATLSTGDSAGGQQVGKLVGLTMRVGSPVVVDDKFVAYSLSTDTGGWQADTLGGSGGLQTPKDMATYDGNLYLLDSKPGQISKFPSGQYTQAPIDWVQDQASLDAMKSPVAIAIDGEIYVALADGKILIMQGGKLTQTITPKTQAAGQSQSAPTRLFTNTDVKDLYVLRADDGTISHITKDGSTVATLKAPAGMGLDKLSGMTVDEAKGIYYLVQGSKVYQATTAPSAPPSTGATTTNGGVPAQSQPASSPVVLPTVSP
jgi:hypothetical protein